MAAVWRSRCAFSRLFTRKTDQILNNAPDLVRKQYPVSQLILKTESRSYSNYARSPFVEKVKEKYNYKMFKDPPEWIYVERLLPFETIPEVTPKESYPSGWVPPKEESKELPYYIERTKNHLLPIYLNLSNRGARKITMIKKIDGDIWLLNDEIKSYLSDKNMKYIETRVHELTRIIEVKGDYVIHVRDWAYSKGF